MSFINLSNLVREMTDIKNAINIFIFDMSRDSVPGMHDNGIEPIYLPPKANGGISIVLYTCAKGQQAKEVSE
jgi:hypothetical protein